MNYYPANGQDPYSSASLSDGKRYAAMDYPPQPMGSHSPHKGSSPSTSQAERIPFQDPRVSYPISNQEAPFHPPESNPYGSFRTQQTAQGVTLGSAPSQTQYLGEQTHYDAERLNPQYSAIPNHNQSPSQLATWGPPQCPQPPNVQYPARPSSSTSFHASHSASLPSEATYFDQAPAFVSQKLPLSSHSSCLSRPIAIPQSTHGRGLPFLRAWAPILESQNITQAEFLAFIDNLNVVSTANPPLQVLKLAGGIIGLVPYHWAHIAGFAIQSTAQIGTAAVSKGGTEMYMKEANDKLFGPHHLKVSIASGEAMRAILGMPQHQPMLATLTAETMQWSAQQRILAAVEPYNARLELNVPAPTEQTTMLAKLSARQVEAQEKKTQKKALEEREKAREKEEKRLRREAKKEKKHEKKDGPSSDHSDPVNGLKQESHTRRDAKHGKDEKHEKKDKETKNAEKLLWLVIENA